MVPLQGRTSCQPRHQRMPTADRSQATRSSQPDSAYATVLIGLRNPRSFRSGPLAGLFPACPSPVWRGIHAGLLLQAFLAASPSPCLPSHPRALPRFTATMEALTPACRPWGHAGACRSLRFMSLAFLIVPSPTTRQRADIALIRYPSSVPAFPSFRWVWTSHIPSRLVSLPGRIVFTWVRQSVPALRTNRSPPAALHPTSR
jgi:hypothetical protein